MIEALTVLLVLVAASFSYWLSCLWLFQIMPRRGQIAIRIGLALATILAGFDFIRPWVFPLAFGLLVGSLLSTEFC